MTIPGYTSVEEALGCAQSETDRALGAVLAMLAGLYFEKKAIRLRLQELDADTDEDEVAELEWSLKMLRNEESSLHRLESGLQSRLKVP